MSTSKAIPNTFLRKKRKKWPHSPFKTQWHYTFNQQQALQNLQQQLDSTHHQKPSQNPNPQTPFLLNCLIDSFSIYNCDPTPNAYHLVIKTLIRNSQFNELNFVLTHIQNAAKFDTPESFFVDLIRVYGENGMISEAISLFFEIPNFRCVPTVLSLNSLLVILCKDRDFLKFVPQILLKSSRVMNIRMEESSFSILISALCSLGRVDCALKLLNYMIDDGFNPDGKVYSLVLSSLCRQDDVTSFEVMGILEEMKRVGFSPSRTDFRNVIRFLIKKGKGKDGFNALCEMKRAGIKPDIACYTMALHGLVEEGEFSRVEEVFDELLVFGLVPDVRTYNAYIRGLCKQKKVDAAYAMMGYMQELNCKPNSATYKTVMEGFRMVGELGRARELHREMKLKGMDSDLETYVDELVSGGECGDACD